MKIGLAVYEFRNNDIEFNLRQIEKALENARGKVDLLCFSETFLQGFDALTWEYGHDRQVAVSRDSETMARLCAMTEQYQTDLLFGYIEKDGEALYSSCAVISDGRIIHNYRRITRGWKEYSITDGHYQEGTDTAAFEYFGRKIRIALCGDLWDCPEQFMTEDLLIWPVYVSYSLEEWEEAVPEYAEQAGSVSRKTLLVNAISKDPDAHGGAFVFEGSTVAARLPFDQESILIAECE